MSASRRRGRLRTVAAEYRIGERVRLNSCPDPGEVREIGCVSGHVYYRMTWENTPADNSTWYEEQELCRVEAADQ